ncbi:MAG: sulfur carrier protein ThiS [Deltaproteobacteria bacterium]|nr:sulfur carrier protein ThiS [Deltaproteobacteria bacterium]
MKVNGNEIDFEQGMTVASLLARMGFVFPLLVIRVNGALVARDAYDRTPLSDNDLVEVVHLMSGG